MSTGAGADLVYGNEGADSINAGDGNNVVIGGFGGSDGNDTIVTGAGADTIWASQGNDTVDRPGPAPVPTCCLRRPRQQLHHFGKRR